MSDRVVINAWSDLPEAVRFAIYNVQEWSGSNRHKNTSANAAFGYVMALNEVIMTYGTRGAKAQLLYIVANLSTWRGDNARAAKKTLNDFIATIGVVES